MSIAGYSFEERLGRAATVPSSWYTDPEVFALETRKVFGCACQLVGRAEQVVRPGDYFTASIADEPIVVARGDDENMRAFSNVCRHRAGLRCITNVAGVPCSYFATNLPVNEPSVSLASTVLFVRDRRSPPATHRPVSFLVKFLKDRFLAADFF